MIKVTCAIIIQHKKILITQRGNHPRHPFQWEFPGGKTEPEETDKECVERELKEELNLHIEAVQKLHPVQFDYGFREIELIPFICHIKSGEIQLKEHVDFKWLSLSEIKKINLSAADKKLLQHPVNRQAIENRAAT
ncbi:8-oxo-dGTP diphosphatase [Mariniphaga anaerophila]|uniref:8-oxo-dGTP diphosphatase n=1 Tax=Mariniphaga anaerophila TaxID=1484053 RepID=A0A1M5EF41_9BACT|nr:(deoxy)nucleoside triphosphate pyrophosphohydrolase [Mariniphaga anaerophila]SHF77849.1 8-oxo-dGTP diphosphatase [Mariniphaga anaerophila]